MSRASGRTDGVHPRSLVRKCSGKKIATQKPRTIGIILPLAQPLERLFKKQAVQYG